MKRIEALAYRLSDEGWEQLLHDFEALGHRAALVGAKGSGKTTLLLELERHFEAEGWHLLRLRLSVEEPGLTAEEWRALQEVDERCLVTVDGAEQLALPNRWRLRWLVRRAGGLLITVHRRGFWPILRLPTLRHHRTDIELLADLVRELTDSETVRRLEGELPALFERHEGNLRDCLRELYDVWGEGWV